MAKGKPHSLFENTIVCFFCFLETESAKTFTPSILPHVPHLLGGGTVTPLQYSCLENPMDRTAWWATVHGVAMSQTQLKRLSTSLTTFLEDVSDMETFLLWLQCSEQIENPHFNDHTEFYRKRHYICHCRKTVVLIGVWVLERDFKSVFLLLGCVSLDKVLSFSVLPQYPHLFHRNNGTYIIKSFFLKKKKSRLIDAEHVKG